MSQERTVVHLVRHGEVDNPTGVLYGRLPQFYLSELGREMAERVADHLAELDVTHLRCSPLERAQQTMEPIAARFPELSPATDGRVIEASSFFEGRLVSLKNPRNWWLLRNPFKPSWGEPYQHVVARMRLALADAAAEAAGHEAVIVSHQLPIWMARSDVEGRRLVHDPRKRQCTLASVTSFNFIDGRVTSVSYAEPALDLVPPALRSTFSAGA